MFSVGHNSRMPMQTISHGRITWMDITRPTPVDVETLGRAYPYIHPLNLEDLLSPLERPKLDLDENYLLVVLHFPVWDSSQRLTRAREVDLILGRGYVVTIHDGSLKVLTTLFEMCQRDIERRQEVMGGASGRTFYVIIDTLVDYILPMLRKVDSNIRKLEESIFTTDSRQVIRDIVVHRRDIIALRRIIRQQVPILEQLEKTDHPILHEDLEEYFGDIVDHVYKARDIIDENAEIITGLSETADTLASHRINEVMRILTVISVVMLPLTLLSSIYGMNIDLPLMHDPNAFIIVSGWMVMITIFMLVYFQRRHWL